MISRLQFEKKQNLEKLLPRYSGIITIQSEVLNHVVYGIADHKFAILVPEGSIFCPIHETPELAKKLKPDLAAEVMEIFYEWGKQYVTR